jgi:predicted GNAT family acetyltransferase
MITYKQSLDGVDWEALTETLKADNFDNGRTPEQLRRSFENSFAVCFAYDGERVIGKARALSDQVCNAYIVDVWTLSEYRRRGIASQITNALLERLPGQHVYLFTDDMAEFYESLGFRKRPHGMEIVVGEWLKS